MLDSSCHNIFSSLHSKSPKSLREKESDSQISLWLSLLCGSFSLNHFQIPHQSQIIDFLQNQYCFHKLNKNPQEVRRTHRPLVPWTRCLLCSDRGQRWAHMIHYIHMIHRTPIREDLWRTCRICRHFQLLSAPQFGFTDLVQDSSVWSCSSSPAQHHTELSHSLKLAAQQAFLFELVQCQQEVQTAKIHPSVPPADCSSKQSWFCDVSLWQNIFCFLSSSKLNVFVTFEKKTLIDTLSKCSDI